MRFRNSSTDPLDDIAGTNNAMSVFPVSSTGTTRTVEGGDVCAEARRTTDIVPFFSANGADVIQSYCSVLLTKYTAWTLGSILFGGVS